MSEFIPVNQPLLDGKEKEYLLQCIETGWISSEGPFIKKFEDQIAAVTNRKHAVTVCNGTVALELAVAALNLAPGSEIIVPSFTIISCVSAILRCGCLPVLVDSDPDTWNMDVAKLESKVSPRTKAIMAVHLYGLPVDMNPILDLARKYSLKVIEDASQMLGQTYHEKPCGSFGDISTLSFYPNKHVTTGEGGMVLTDDEEISERCRSLRNLCFKPEKRFVHEEVGYNFRMTNLQAALGFAQVERLESFIVRKRRTGIHYMELLSGIRGLQLPMPQMHYAENVFWVFGLVLHQEVPFDAEEMMRRLGERNIGTRPFFWPMHEQPVFQKMGLFAGESYPVAERLARRGFYIPSGLALSDEQREKVAEAVKNIMEESKG